MEETPGPRFVPKTWMTVDATAFVIGVDAALPTKVMAGGA
jgi:hypothetical protein